jgi:hypothetical protein
MQFCSPVSLANRCSWTRRLRGWPKGCLSPAHPGTRRADRKPPAADIGALSQEIRCTQSLRYHLQEWVMMGMLSCIGARGVDGKALGPILILRDGTNRLCRADAHSGFRIGFRMEQFLPVHRVGSDCRLPFGRGEPGREAMRGSLLRLRMGLWVKQDDIIEIQ